MSNNSAPLNLAKKLRENAASLNDNSLKKDLLEASETIEYLVTLLKECAGYINDFNEYEIPPRFIKAVNEVLP